MNQKEMLELIKGEIPEWANKRFEDLSISCFELTITDYFPNLHLEAIEVESPNDGSYLIARPWNTNGAGGWTCLKTPADSFEE